MRSEEVMVPMADGVALAAEVITVDDGVARPTLLIRTSYSRPASRAAEDPVGLARTGWSVVIQDVRGRFDSEGFFDPFRQERRDGADTIAWCARQPWSDGRVATWGASYLGGTQLLAAAERPPALRAIAPMVTSGWFDEGWTYEGGALQLGFVMPWALMMAMGDPRLSAADQARVLEVASDWDAAYRHPLAGHPARALFGPFDEWMAADPSGAWKPVALAKRMARLQVPGFHVAGWYDIFCDSSLRTWKALSAGGAPQRIVIGPWTHAGLFLESTPEVAFGPEANGIALDLRGEALRWMRRALDGDKVEGGIRVFVMGTNEWRDLPDWPAPATPTTLWLDSTIGANSLRGDGVLRLDAPTDTGRDSFDYDPHNPVPTRGGRTLGPFLPQPGPVDQRAVEERDDVLVYTSESLKQPLTVIGPVTATIRFATTGRSADVTVKLVDVHPDGRALNVVDSVRRIGFTPGRARDVEVAIGATAMTFLRGHRLRVEVSSSNFPRLDRNPSTGEPAGDATELHGARQTVHLGGARPSGITLPVVA